MVGRDRSDESELNTANDEENEKMSVLRISRSTVLPVLAVVGGLAALTVPFLGGAEEKPSTPARAALTVTTVKPTAADWPQKLAASGSIAAWHEASVGAEIGGLRLVDVPVNVGDRVKKGQELARLQSETTAAERDQTRASMAEAEASLAEARANADRARQIEASGALSAQQVAQYLTAETTARARVEVLKARLKADEIRLAQTRILSPDDGTISARFATLGAVVQSGQELFRLVRKDRLEWRAELPSADLLRVKAGMSASVAIGGKDVPGRVRMVAPTLDPQTRKGIVYVDLDAKSGASAGMFASGEIEIGRGKVLTVPQTAVLLRDGFSYVFRIGPDNRVIETKIEIAQRRGDRAALLSGLDVGVSIVATGVGFLADGDLVRVADAAGAAGNNPTSTPAPTAAGK